MVVTRSMLLAAGLQTASIWLTSDSFVSAKLHAVSLEFFIPEWTWLRVAGWGYTDADRKHVADKLQEVWHSAAAAAATLLGWAVCNRCTMPSRMLCAPALTSMVTAVLLMLLRLLA